MGQLVKHKISACYMYRITAGCQPLTVLHGREPPQGKREPMHRRLNEMQGWNITSPMSTITRG
eukprot:585374-Pelagomonas_calceolata.AAC.1